jgi:chemotaxis protein MotB
MSEEGGGGHGGGWIITYCDMVTLLMACFIMIITFGSKEQEKYEKKYDSLIGGDGGKGLVGIAQKALDRDSIVYRQRPPGSRIFESGSDLAPSHHEIAQELSKAALLDVAQHKLGTLSDSYSLEIPANQFFDGSSDQLRPSGKNLLRVISKKVVSLPYDILIQGNNERDLPRLGAIVKELSEVGGIFQGRLAIGIRSVHGSKSTTFSFMMSRQSDDRPVKP